ncbi:hypothetical protein CEXT_28711 [Caerostris extrusa]|uniref:Uncharacterized protein n=1 Tax=Caerostris extrusa TaxID=172846 RepID=A0AAV4MAL8_CAEEX|nr:hypothetical protein CEXT_28711 [Caerostris extrusa]
MLAALPKISASAVFRNKGPAMSKSIIRSRNSMRIKGNYFVWDFGGNPSLASFAQTSNPPKARAEEYEKLCNMDAYKIQNPWSIICLYVVAWLK